MKALISCILVGAAAFAQTPAPAAKKAAPAAAKKTATAPALPPAGKLLTPSLFKATAPAEFKVKFTTTKGDFVIESHRDWAPLGVDRFYNLVKAGFFTNVSFYRVVPKFIVQFGAHANPKVTDAWNKAPIKDDQVKKNNNRGFLTYAMGGPNTRSTEFFVNLKDNTNLDSMGFAPIGEVVEGMEIVDQIYSGYGELSDMGGRGPSQARVQTEGKVYLDKAFPQLDSIKSATVMPGAAPPPPPAVKKSAAPATKSATPATKKTAAPEKK